MTAEQKLQQEMEEAQNIKKQYASLQIKQKYLLNRD